MEEGHVCAQLLGQGTGHKTVAQLMISWARAISNKEEPAVMMPRPANCPALVRLVRDRTTASKVVSPAPLA